MELDNDTGAISLSIIKSSSVDYPADEYYQYYDLATITNNRYKYKLLNQMHTAFDLIDISTTINDYLAPRLHSLNNGRDKTLFKHIQGLIYKLHQIQRRHYNSFIARKDIHPALFDVNKDINPLTNREMQAYLTIKDDNNLLPIINNKLDGLIKQSNSNQPDTSAVLDTYNIHAISDAIMSKYVLSNFDNQELQIEQAFMHAQNDKNFNNLIKTFNSNDKKYQKIIQNMMDTIGCKKPMAIILLNYYRDRVLELEPQDANIEIKHLMENLYDYLNAETKRIIYQIMNWNNYRDIKFAINQLQLGIRSNSIPANHDYLRDELIQKLSAYYETHKLHDVWINMNAPLFWDILPDDMNITDDLTGYSDNYILPDMFTITKSLHTFQDIQTNDRYNKELDAFLQCDTDWSKKLSFNYNNLKTFIHDQTTNRTTINKIVKDFINKSALLGTVKFKNLLVSYQNEDNINDINWDNLISLVVHAPRSTLYQKIDKDDIDMTTANNLRPLNNEEVYQLYQQYYQNV